MEALKNKKNPETTGRNCPVTSRFFMTPSKKLYITMQDCFKKNVPIERTPPVYSRRDLPKLRGSFQSTEKTLHNYGRCFKKKQTAKLLASIVI